MHLPMYKKEKKILIATNTVKISYILATFCLYYLKKTALITYVLKRALQFFFVKLIIVIIIFLS